MSWVVFALMSAAFAALTAVLAKIGVEGVPSSLATAIRTWLAYFRALQLGPASHVAPIDKLSLPLTILLAALVLHEQMTLRLAIGVGLMVVGALLTLR